MKATITATPTIDRGSVIVRTAAENSLSPPFPSSAQTNSIRGAISRFGLVFMPVAAAAAIAAGAPPRIRIFGAPSRSNIAEMDWWLDEWLFTEEAARLDDVDALRSFLATPGQDGFSLDLRDA